MRVGERVNGQSRGKIEISYFDIRLSRNSVSWSICWLILEPNRIKWFYFIFAIIESTRIRIIQLFLRYLFNCY